MRGRVPAGMRPFGVSGSADGWAGDSVVGDTGGVDWDEAYDVVVVGAGTGLFAALTAARAGLKVLLVEKSGYLGGSVAMSAGVIWAPGSAPLGVAEGADSSEATVKYLDQLVGDSAPQNVRRSFLEHAPTAMRLLESATPLSFVSVPGWADHHSDLPGASLSGRAVEVRPFNMAVLGPGRGLIRGSDVAAPVPMPITSVDYKWLVMMARLPWKGLPRAFVRLVQGVGGKLLGRDVVAAGQALVAGLMVGAQSAGVTTWLKTPLRDLVVEDRRATGVVLEHEGRTIRVAARRGVILAAGGFENNTQMRRRHQSPTLAKWWSFNSPTNTGDVLSIAARHGIALSGMENSWWSPGIPPSQRGGKPTFLLAERSLPGSIIVDSTGRRFLNESCDNMTAGQKMLERQGSDGAPGPTWFIFDQKYRNSFILGGRILPGLPLPGSWYRAGIAHRARSVSDLAQQLGMPHLWEGVNRFNAQAARGSDDDFGRGNSAHDRYWGDPTNTPNPTLRPLTRGPFHAVQLIPGDIGTCGGISIDGCARALRTDGSVMSGLYAAGNSAASVFGDCSPHFGATLGQALTFGWIAAQHVADRLDGAGGK